MSLVSRRFAALFMLFVLMLSCSSHDPIRVRFDDSVSEADRARAWSAMQMINGVTADDDEVKFVVDPSGDELFSTPEFIRLRNGEEMDGRECTDVGTDCARGNWVRVRSGLDDDRKLAVMKHELFHVLDLHHVKARAIMHRSTDSLTPTEADMQECREAGACASITVTVVADDRPWFKRVFGRPPRKRRPPHVELEADRECH